MKCETCNEKIVGVGLKMNSRDGECNIVFCSDLCRSRFPFKYERTNHTNRPLKLRKN